MDLRRVAVVGTSCAGKTTFAAALAAQLQVPHIELDALHWRAGWVPAPGEVFRQAVTTAVAAERWVSDGNYGVVRDLVWGRATAVVWLDYPFATVLRRALYRTARRALLREQLYGGNRETFRKSTAEPRFDSLVGRHHLGAPSARIPGAVRAGRLRASRGRGLRQPARGRSFLHRHAARSAMPRPERVAGPSAARQTCGNAKSDTTGAAEATGMTRQRHLDRPGRCPARGRTAHRGRGRRLPRGRRGQGHRRRGSACPQAPPRAGDRRHEARARRRRHRDRDRAEARAWPRDHDHHGLSGFRLSNAKASTISPVPWSGSPIRTRTSCRP